MAGKVTVLDHPLLKHKLGYLRDKNTASSEFRELVKEISRILAHEVMRDWTEMREVVVETPIAQTKVERISNAPVVVSILRAGNGMLDAAEGGIAGITLSLKAVTSLTRQTEIITTMSNEEGKYEFIGLSRSVYRLEAQNTVQWLCDSQNPQRVVVASFITRKAINVTFQKPVVTP